MNLTVLDRHFNILTMVDLSNTNPNEFNIYNDLMTYSITDGVSLATFSAMVPKRFKESKYFLAGNYLALKDEWNHVHCLVINDVKENHDESEIYAEDLGLDLLNSQSLAFDSNLNQPVEYYVNRELYDTGWEIGRNDIKTKKKVTFDSSSTTLKRLQDIATAFECEIYFDIAFQGNNLVKQQVNIVHQIGSETPVTRLINGENMTAWQKEINFQELKTAVYAYGANGKDIAGLSYNDGKYRSYYGSNLVVDLDASNEWNRFPNKSKSDQGYYEMVNNSDSEDVNEILSDAIKALEQYSSPKVTYESTVIYNPGEVIGLGDYVQLVDASSEIYLKARVTGFEVSRTNSSNNKVVLSNYTELSDGISTRIKSLQTGQNRLENQLDMNVRVETYRELNGTIWNIYARVFRGSEDITDQFSDSDFIWKKHNYDGTEDEEWQAKYSGSGKMVQCDINEIDRDADIECILLVYPFMLVSVQWFQRGLRNMVNKIKSKVKSDSSVILFATDIHQALSSAIRANTNIYRHSNEHIKNIAELTNMIDIDLVVLGGDIADGSMTKAQQVASLKQVMSTLGMSNARYMVCKGNHDDNSWYAKTLCGTSWDFKNVVMPNEMNQLLIDPIRHQEGMNVTNFQTAYVDINNIRHIILNTSDVPYILNSNGNPKFLGLETRAYSPQQLKWLVDVLKSTPNDFKVCLYQHIGFGNTYSTNNYTEYNVTQMMDILNAFQHHKKVTIKNDDPNFITNITADFTNNKATIIYGMHGHYHNDKLMKWNDINFVSTGCSAPVPRHLDGTGLLDNRQLQTLNEDLFDVVIITPSKKKVELLRFGAGKDRSISL